MVCSKELTVVLSGPVGELHARVLALVPSNPPSGQTWLNSPHTMQLSSPFWKEKARDMSVLSMMVSAGLFVTQMFVVAVNSVAMAG